VADNIKFGSLLVGDEESLAMRVKDIPGAVGCQWLGSLLFGLQIKQHPNKRLLIADVIFSVS
jgi:hypothetical protein